MSGWRLQSMEACTMTTPKGKAGLHASGPTPAPLPGQYEEGTQGLALFRVLALGSASGRGKIAHEMPAFADDAIGRDSRRQRFESAGRVNHLSGAAWISRRHANSRNARVSGLGRIASSKSMRRESAGLDLLTLAQ